jgi:general secretion pathway protein F
MPVYSYTGVNAAGKKRAGVLDADNPRALRDALKTQGVFVTEFREGRAAEAPAKKGEVRIELPWQNRISLLDIAVMTRQLATLQKAGIPLVECLAALVEQSENENLRAIIAEVKTRVNEGSSLAVALGKHPKVFGDLYVNMIRAGESSGNLDVVLIRLTEFLDDQVKLQDKLRAAMTYPALMAVLTLGIVTYLMVSVVPKITQIFEDQGESLPFITDVLIFVSAVVSGWWWLLLALAGGAWWYFRRWKATPEGRAILDQRMLKAPVIGSLVRMVAVSRFAKTLSTLLASGVPLLTAMDIVKNILGNTVLIRVVEQARLNIREGESIAGPLKRSGEFPPMVTHMIAVGERTGELENMLANVAEAYDQQITTRVAALTSLLEPIMIIVMGGVVGFIVFAILLPIMQMNQAFTS